MEAHSPLTHGHLDFDDLDDSPPARHHSGIRPGPQTASGVPDERESGIQLTADCPTLPPPARASEADVVVLRIRLVPSIDEILYRLSLGDQKGAFLAAVEFGPLVPRVVAPRVVLAATQLPHLEEYVLSFVDSYSTWAEILESSPFAPADTLGALCELVDKRIIAVG
jgi:hypothetical protein